MDKNRVLANASWAMAILGLIMIYMGGFQSSRIMLPPIVTGIGFLVIAWTLNGLKRASSARKRY